MNFWNPTIVAKVVMSLNRAAGCGYGPLVNNLLDAGGDPNTLFPALNAAANSGHRVDPPAL